MFRSQEKNIDPATAMLATTAISSMLGIAGGQSSASASKYAANLNYRSQQETNETLKNIALRNITSQEMENSLNRQWNKYMYEYAFNKENEYNSPSAQLARLADAGINPYRALSGGNPNVAGNMSVSPEQGSLSPQIPNLQAPKYEPLVQNSFSKAAELFDTMTRGYKAIQEGVKAGEDADNIKPMVDSNIAKNAAQANEADASSYLKQVQATSEATKNMISQKELALLNTYGDQEQHEKIRGLSAYADKMFNEATESFKRGDILDIEKEIRQLDKYIRENDKFMSDIDRQGYVAMMQAKLEQMRALTKNYLAGANAYNAQAKDSLSHVAVNETQAELNDAIRFETDERSQYAGANAEADVQEKRSRSYKNYREADKPKTLIEGVMDVPDKVARNNQGRTSLDYDTKGVRKQYRGSKSPGVLKRKKR